MIRPRAAQPNRMARLETDTFLRHSFDPVGGR
jgi:hypothetical protein